MTSITKLISTAKDSFSRLIVKVRRLGLNDVQTSYQVAPFGYDSNPVADVKYVPIYAKTGVKGETVIVGYIQQGMMTEPGQVRIFQIFEGEVGTDIFLKNNKILLGGETGSGVIYEPLDDALQIQATAINAELIKIQTAISSLGGAYARVDVSIDTSAARSTKTTIS